MYYIMYSRVINQDAYIIKELSNGVPRRTKANTSEGEHRTAPAKPTKEGDEWGRAGETKWGGLQLRGMSYLLLLKR